MTDKPVYSIKKIVTLRDKIYDNIILKHGGTVPEGKTFGHFVLNILDCLPLSVDYEALFNSVRHLAGKPIDKEEIFNNAWRIAGNLHHLRNSVAVPPWVHQAVDEWVPVQITETKPYRRKDKARGFLYAFRVMAGTSCPRTVIKFWSIKFCRFIAQEMGFSAPWNQFPFTDGHEFVSMRMHALIDADRSNEEPFFEKTNHPPSCVAWNKTILKARMRIDPPCPNGYTFPCFKCHIGYTDCLAGCHPMTYVKRFCVECELEDFFDPAKNDSKCVNCTNKRNA